MTLALGFAAAGFTLGVVLTALCAAYVFGLVRDDMARQLEGYGAVSLFAEGARRDDHFNQGCLP